VSRVRQLIAYAALGFLSIALWIAVSVSGLLDGLEGEALRWRYLARGELASDAPIVFVNLDPKTIAKMGDRPWDRLNFAQTIEALLGPGQARAVAVDIIFSPLGGGSLLDVERARKGDFALGETVQRHPDKVILAAAYTGTNQAIEVLPLRRYGYRDPSEVPFPESPTFPILTFESARLGLANVDEALSKGSVPLKVPAIVDTEGEAFSRHWINGQLRAFHDILNKPERVSQDGFHRIVDADGFALDPVPVRSSHRLLTIGLEAFLAAHGLDSGDVEWREEALLIRKEGAVFRRVPLIDGQSMEVNWFRGWDIDRPGMHYSMADVLEAANALGAAAASGDAGAVADLEQWFERFRGKVVFIGGVDATLKDLAPTPFNRTPVPKVGLHANVFRTVEAEAYVTEVDAVASQLLLIGLAGMVSILILWSGRGKSYTRAGAVLVLLAYIVMVFYGFAEHGLLIPLVAPLGASVSSALFVILCKLGFEERQRRRIKSLFGAYVSPSLVDEMVESERDPELGGTEVRVTALFSDVEGFSALSEELSPNDLVTLMNEYLGAMTRTFQDEQGTLDKYIGDAIVTMFGMPYPVEDHAARACRSAVKMQERHAELRERWAQEGRWPERVRQMRTRIGINTGEAVIGNMGSEMRFNYTMMGDSVNLAARCESGAKSYGVYTMITEDTLEAALRFGEQLNYRKLDRIIVKGRSQPVDIYELWDGTVDTVVTKSCKTAYEAALEDYFKGEWQSALAGFEACASQEPTRGYAPTSPSEVLAARCRELLAHGAPELWDGVYRMTSK
jgi:adenylate cyclase